VLLECRYLFPGQSPVLIFSRYAGYANSVIGSIVANQGFIDQYGTVKDPVTGKLALNATYIALWGALYFVTCIAIQLVAPTTADRYGRKFNMWGITVFIGIVSSSLEHHLTRLTRKVHHHSMLLQNLVGDTHRSNNCWICRWTDGDVVYGVHVRDRNAAISGRSAGSIFHGICSWSGVSGCRLESSSRY
jgi:hypothetical protein